MRGADEEEAHNRHNKTKKHAQKTQNRHKQEGTESSYMSVGRGREREGGDSVPVCQRLIACHREEFVRHGTIASPYIQACATITDCCNTWTFAYCTHRIPKTAASVGSSALLCPAVAAKKSLHHSHGFRWLRITLDYYRFRPWPENTPAVRTCVFTATFTYFSISDKTYDEEARKRKRKRKACVPHYLPPLPSPRFSKSLALEMKPSPCHLPQRTTEPASSRQRQRAQACVLHPKPDQQSPSFRHNSNGTTTTTTSRQKNEESTKKAQPEQAAGRTVNEPVTRQQRPFGCEMCS